MLGLFVLGLLYSASLNGQVAEEEFGKNRVQYHDDFDDWSVYESDHFLTYWYGKSRNIGHVVVQMAEVDLQNIQNLLEHRLNQKIEILVYMDVTDMKQSNIGNEETFESEAGQTKIVGNKLFVYFDGNHRNLRIQLREGIARVYLNQMLFGSNLQEFVQNAVLSNLPSWYKDGLISFLGEHWNVTRDNALRQLLLHKEYEDFFELTYRHPKLAGHAFWYYIHQTYGKTAISNLLYLTRINRNLENGFLYVIGVPFEQCLQNCLDHYRELYRAEVEALKKPPFDRALDIKKRKKEVITSAKLSPDDSELLYVVNEIGKTKVYRHSLVTDATNRVFKEGFRNPFQETDKNYPMIAWSPSGQKFAILNERRDVPSLYIYDRNGELVEKQEISPEFHRIYSMDFYTEDRLLFSASTNGLSDLFLYTYTSRQTRRITQDIWDDLDASTIRINGKPAIVFSSNRPRANLLRNDLDTTLPLRRFDLFLITEQKEGRTIHQLTATPGKNERLPQQAGRNEIQFLSDASGIVSRHGGFLNKGPIGYQKMIHLNDGSTLKLDVGESLDRLDTSRIDRVESLPVEGWTFEPRQLTRYQTNIETFSSGEQRVLEVFHNAENRWHLIESLKNGEKVDLGETDQSENQSMRDTVPEEEQTVEDRDKSVYLPAYAKPDSAIYKFQSRFPDPDPNQSRVPLEPQMKPPEQVSRLSTLDPIQNDRIEPFVYGRAIAHRLHFRIEKITTNLDNDLLFGGLDTYAGTKEGFDFRPLGILIKGEARDLFEDYEFEGGARFPTTFDGSEWFLVFDDLKDRLDKRYAFYRRSNFESMEQGTQLNEQRTISHIGYFRMSYPLDIYRSIRFSTTLRLDRTVQLATDLPSLRQEDLFSQRLGFRLSYVFDNTFNVMRNIRNGTRYKFYVEALNRFNLEFSPLKLEPSNGYMTILGADIRHYQRLDRYSILAARLAGNTSIGGERIMYFMGGVENWLFPENNETTPLPQSGSFAYQTPALNMRGFKQNIRNGSSYVLLNTELRIPFFNYFTKRKIRSSLLRNFQLIGFLDMGTAWHGWNPFSDKNPINSVTFTTPPSDVVSITVDYFRDPLVIGYGFGVRTSVLGYFLRLDYGWGIETRQVQEPIFYLSMGMDF